MNQPDRDEADLTGDTTLVGRASEPVPGGPELSGDLGDRFRILSLLGRGGMGEVYAAEDLTLGRRVALKAIRPEHRLSPAARERFLREARLLSRLDHPGICRIHDLVDSGDRDFLVLEFIEGRTLRAAGDKLDDKTRLEVAYQIAVVLEAAHTEGIVHRDLKPENIMLTDGRRAKVLDFGLARDLAKAPVPQDPAAPVAGGTKHPDLTIDLSLVLSRGGAVLGTPAYLSPEQAHGEPATAASDMYSFGLVLQRLFTGQRAYGESGNIEIILEQAREARTIPAEGVDRDLAALIESLKQRSPAARPTAAEARRRLAWIQRKPARRLRRLAVAAAVVLILAAGGKYMLDLRHERRIAERHRAEAEDLVEFMLGDLRERLEPVGRLDVLDEVGDRALQYYAARSADERTDADHHRFAKAMNQIGEVRLNQGDLDAAREAFTEARRAALAIVDNDTGQGEWLLNLGASEFWLGNVAYLEGDLDGAEEAFEAYRAVAERLVALDAKNEVWQRELGYAFTNLAVLHEAKGETTEALRILDESIRIKRILLDAAPDDAGRRSDLINALAWQARIMVAAGELRTADERYAVAVDETSILVASDPDDMSHRYLQSNLLQLHATTGERLGKDARAGELYLASLRIARQLVAHDESNATWRLSLAISHLSCGMYEVHGRNAEDARDHLLGARALVEELVEVEPGNVDLLSHYAEIHWGLGLAALQVGDLTAARVHTERALVQARRARELGGDLSGTAILAKSLVLSGEIERNEGRTGQAIRAWGEAHDLLEPVVQTSRVGTTRDVWMRILAFGERTAEARQVGEDLHATGYARRDFERFRVEHGLLAIEKSQVK